MGAFLVDLFQADQPGKGKQELQDELTALRTGSNETVRSYYIRKFSTVLMVLTIGVVLSIVCFFAYAGKTSDVEDQTLMRPGYGEGNRQEELAVEVDGKEVRQLEITIQERKYTEKEKRELTERAIKELEQILPGQNKSLDEVREDLVFPETLMDGAVTASYVTTPYGIVDESGVLLDVEKEDGVLVEIQVTLTCGENEMRHVVHAKVFPRILTQDEQLQKEIRRAVEQRDAKESHEETLELPGNVDGRRLVWQYQEENPFATVFALALIAAVLVYLEMDSRVHARAEDRKNQLMLDYPDLMWKMTMLLGAGLTIKGTFQRMAKQYYRDRRKLRYVYEEVLYTCREMESGVSQEVRTSGVYPARLSCVAESEKRCTRPDSTSGGRSAFLHDRTKEQCTQAWGKGRNEASVSDDPDAGNCDGDFDGTGISGILRNPIRGSRGKTKQEKEKKRRSSMDHVTAFLKEEDGVGVVEIILILVVLISLVLIFKKQLTSLVKSILSKAVSQSNNV